MGLSSPGRQTGAVLAVDLGMTSADGGRMTEWAGQGSNLRPSD
jgi:hypothetical protein